MENRRRRKSGQVGEMQRKKRQKRFKVSEALVGPC